MSERKSRCVQLRAMGIVAWVLPALAAFHVYFVQGLPFPQSISETATIPWATDWLLPLCLGALGIFALRYWLENSYDYKPDKVLPAIMGVSFILVAAQMCESPHITAERIGLFWQSQHISHIIHCIAAITGFGAMTLWILLCFTRSNRSKKEQSLRKRVRNSIYGWCGIGMIASLSIVVLDFFKVFGHGFPVVYAVEWAMLFFGGAACFIKGGVGFGDKPTAEDAEKFNNLH